MSDTNSPKLPSHIALRTAELAPLLIAWRKANPRSPWGRLITRGLLPLLAPYAKKRTRHLLRDVIVGDVVVGADGVRVVMKPKKGQVAA